MHALFKSILVGVVHISEQPFPVLPAESVHACLQVLLEDAVSVFGQFLKYLTSDFSKVNPLDTDLIYLRNPFNPYVSAHCHALNAHKHSSHH